MMTQTATGTVTRDEDDNTRLDCRVPSYKAAWKLLRAFTRATPFDIVTDKVLRDGGDVVCKNPLVLFAMVGEDTGYFELSHTRNDGLPGLCVLTVLVERGGNVRQPHSTTHSKNMQTEGD